MLRPGIPLLALFLLASAVQPVCAQDEKPDDPKPAAAEQSVLEKLIYVPYRKLADVFGKQEASVVVPYAEYMKMLERMMEPKAGQPVDAVITSAVYRAAVEGDVAKISAELKVQITGKPWVRVPVTFGDAAIGKVEGDKGNVLLQGTGNGTYALLFSEAGEQTVRIELVARVVTSPEGRSLALKTPQVGITTFELTVPKSDQAIQVTPKRVVQTEAAEGDQTRVTANVGSTNQITAKWTPQASAKPQMDLLTSVTNDLAVRIDEGLIHRTAKMTFKVLRGEMDELSFVVPANDRLLDVISAGNQIRKWNTEKEAGRQVVTVQLLAPTESGVSLEIRTEQTLPDGELEIGGIADDGQVNGIHAVGVVRESGQLSVVSSKELSVNILRQNQVTRTAQSANGFAWRFYGSKMDVAVKAEPIVPRVLLYQTAQYAFTDENELKLTASLTYTVERAGIFEVVLNVPDGLTIDNVRGPGVSDFNVTNNVLKVTFDAKKMGAFQLIVTARKDFAPALQAAQPFPFLAADGVERHTGGVLVLAPPAIEITTVEDSIQNLFPQEASRRTQVGDARLVSAWSYTRGPVAMSASLSRKPPRLTATVDTDVAVKPNVMTVNTRVGLNVQNAGIDMFRIAVPAGFDEVRITSASAIKQQTKADAAEDGFVTWTVVMQKKVRGAAALNVSYDVATVADEENAAADERVVIPDVTVQPVRVLAAGSDADIEPVQVTGEVAITKDESLSVNANADGTDIETIDVRELTRIKSDASLAFRYFQQDGELTVSAIKYAIKPVVETVVSRAAVEVVLGRDATATYLCRYLIRSSERQRLRVDLPRNSELLDQSVDASRISLTPIDGAGSAEWDAFYVNLGSSGSGSGANTFRLSLQFRAPLPDQRSDPFDAYGGTQRMQLPRVGGGDSEVVVRQLRTALWVPKQFALIGQPANFVRQYESAFANSWPLRLSRASGSEQLDSWIGGNSTGAVDFPREGHSYVYSSLGAAQEITVRWWNMPFSVWIISGAVFLIGLVLRNTAWENKLTIVLIAALAAVLYALLDRETVMQSAFAASYGLLAVLILWTIYGLRNTVKSDEPAAGGSSPPPPASEPPSPPSPPDAPVEPPPPPPVKPEEPQPVGPPPIPEPAVGGGDNA